MGRAEGDQVSRSGLGQVGWVGMWVGAGPEGGAHCS